MKWNVAAPDGILSVPNGGNSNHKILIKYQSISSANIADAFVARTNDRAIQNSNALYAMISKSITRTICNTTFEKAQNLPNNEDGVALFNPFMPFTVNASLQLSILSYNQITSLLPSTYVYIIPTINTKLTRLFLIACMLIRVLEDEE